MAMNRCVIWEVGTKSLREGVKMVVREKPRASAGHVVVRLLVRSVSVEENLIAEMTYIDERNKSVVVGMEGCGVVDEVGDGVSRFGIGERVHVFFVGSSDQDEESVEGSWQDYVEVAEEDLLEVPEFMPTEVAAQQLTAWTAYGILTDLSESVPKGEYILQTAAGSTLGRLVIKLAKHWGMKTINLVRREELKAELKSLGADEVIDSSTEDVIGRVKEITGGRGAYIVMDCVGGQTSKMVGSCVRDGGEFLAMGTLESKDFIVAFSDLCRGVKHKEWDSERYATQKDLREKTAIEVNQLFKDNIFELRPIWKRFPLEKFRDAVSEIETDRGRHGMIILTS